MPGNVASRKTSFDEPVRIVYHAGERTFARLFNESSLEEVKTVVRRKLGLDKSTHVTLKQMKSGKLLDLEDDDDFEAFEALLRSSPSMDIDIEVSVGGPANAVMLPVAPQPREQPPTRVSPAPEPSSSKSKATGTQSAIAVEPSTSTAKTPKRKRTVSFGDVGTSEPTKSAEKPSQKKQRVQDEKVNGPSVTTAIPVASTSAAEAPAEAPKAAEKPEKPRKKQKAEAVKAAGPSAPSTTPVLSTSTVEPLRAEPPKEKRKKEKKKAKDVQPAEAGEPSKKKTSDASHTSAPAIPATTEREKETETSAAVGTSKPTVKKQSKQKKDGNAKKPSASADRDGVDSSVKDSSNSVEEGTVQPVLKKQKKSIGEGQKSEGTKRPPKSSACALVPPTSASKRLQDEITAAILASLNSSSSRNLQPVYPALYKGKKKESEKPPLPPPTARSIEPETVPDASTIVTADAPTESTLDPTDTSTRPLTRPSKPTGPACPICLQYPFHIRYCCPIVTRGPDAIQKRLEELESTSASDQQSLIKELKDLLRDSKGSPDAPPADDRPGEPSPKPSVPVASTPLIPSNSYLSEVTVESRDEGSSSDSSEDASGDEDKVSPVVQRQPIPTEKPPVVQDDLEAVIRGPVVRRQSALDLLDQVVSDEDEKSDSEEEKVELEEDEDEDIGRSKRQSTKRKAVSSDSETEEEESSPPSAQTFEEMDDDPPPNVEAQNGDVETHADPQDADVVMKDPVADALAPEKQVDDSGEETQVEPDEGMAVDDDSMAKAAVAGEAASPAPVSDTRPSNVPTSQPLESQAAPRVTAESDTIAIPADNSTTPPDVPAEVDADPIEPADDLEPPSESPPPNADPIEAGSPPPEDGETLFTNLVQTTPKAGVSKRLRNRFGTIPDSDEHPVTLEQMAAEAQDVITPLPANGRTRRKSMLGSASQEPVTARKSARLSSVPPPTTHAAVVLLNRRIQGGVKPTKVAKTPAKQTEDGFNPSQSSTTSDKNVAVAPTPTQWESLAEPPSSPRIDEPPMQVDELMSSPAVDGSMALGRPNGKAKKGRPRKTAPPAASQSSQEKERLFDLTPSQVPFPYSQYRDPAPVVHLDKQEEEASTDSEEEKALKKKTKGPARKSIPYRSLSQLASQATTFSPSLLTPTHASGSNGKAKKKVADDSSSSSSDSDSDGANGSEHIPQERRAGSVLATKRRKSLLSRMKG